MKGYRRGMKMKMAQRGRNSMSSCCTNHSKINRNEKNI